LIESTDKGARNVQRRTNAKRRTAPPFCQTLKQADMSQENSRNFVAFFFEDAWCEVHRHFSFEETSYQVKFKDVNWIVEFENDPFASMITDERRAEALRGFAIGVLQMLKQFSEK